MMICGWTICGAVGRNAAAAADSTSGAGWRQSRSRTRTWCPARASSSPANRPAALPPAMAISNAFPSRRPRHPSEWSRHQGKTMAARPVKENPRPPGRPANLEPLADWLRRPHTQPLCTGSSPFSPGRSRRAEMGVLRRGAGSCLGWIRALAAPRDERSCDHAKRAVLTRPSARAGRPGVLPAPRCRSMAGAVLRAGAWPAVAGISGVAVVVGGCGAAFPAAATALLPVCFALLAAAAAFTLDEPASLVVDVTPTGPARRTAIRAVALLAPLAAGALVLLAAALRGLALPWAAAGLALAGNVLLGFAAACVARTRTGEPGAAAGAAVVLVLMAPGLVPQVARWVRTFPAPGADGQSSDHVWWIVLAVCVVAIAISV